jgi:hypothetical protein
MQACRSATIAVPSDSPCSASTVGFRRARHTLVAAWIGSVFFATAPPALAQPAEPAEGPSLRPVLVSGEWHYGTPLRNAAGAALFIVRGRGQCEDGICVWPGFQATAHVGAGGWRMGAGPAWGPLFGADVQVTATRTSSAPRGAAPNATYLGLEAGYQLLFVRSSVGVGRRVDGPAGPRRTIVTWNLAVRIPLSRH